MLCGNMWEYSFESTYESTVLFFVERWAWEQRETR